MKLFFALLISKLYLGFNKLIGKGKSDKAGLLAARICPEILTKIKKPKLVIMVSGTNGKSTISHLLYDILKLDGKKIAFNTWNANMRAGHIRCLLDSVNIFNKSTKDIALLECDEVTSNLTVPEINPQYLIVTNLCRDSIRRNSYPEYVFSKLNDATNKNTTTKLILNADDPISSFLGENSEKVYISMDKFDDTEVYENISQDFITCPKCNSIVNYEYRHYRHIGKFKCPSCGLESKKGDFVINNILQNDIVINGIKYKKLSNNLFNAYNEAMVIVLLKELGYSDDYIKEALQKVEIPKSRENLEIQNGIKIYSQMAKGQNGSALSTVLESLSKIDSKKQIILLLDEDFGSVDAQETITWLYDSDMELLNKLNLEQVIVAGARYLDYIVRFKLAGIDENKIIALEDYNEVYKQVNLDGKSDIYVLYDVDRRPTSREVIESLKKRIIDEVK